MIDERDLPHAIYPDPNILYEKDPYFRQSLLKKYMVWYVGPLFGIGSHLLYNWIYYRPKQAGLHRYFLWAVVGGLTGHALKYTSDNYFSYRDRVYKHYIKLHPEDFPLPPKVKIAEKWEPWVPVR